MHEQSRYQRQLILPVIGMDGQRALARGHAAIIGMGALGCVVADLLARAGVARLTLIDRDVVEFTNLQRQTLYTEEDAQRGLSKVEAATERIKRINSQVLCDPRPCDLIAANVETELGLLVQQGGRPDVLVDGTDNFETRYLLNDVSVKHNVPLIYGGVIGTRGMHAVFLPGDGPCLRCVFEELPAPGVTPTCDTAGVLGSAVAAVGAAQALDAMKVMLGRRDAISRTLTEFDIWAGTRRVVDLSGFPARVDCPACGTRQFEFLNSTGSGSDTTSVCGQDAVQVRPLRVSELALEALAERLAPFGPAKATRFMLRFEPSEAAGIRLSVFRDGRVIVHGTTSPEQARSLYARFIGA